MFSPVIKYRKNNDTKEFDMTRPPSIRAKVPKYEGKWNIEIYDQSEHLLFPILSDPESVYTPIDFVPKLSMVKCEIGISQIWTGGKGWGCTLKLIQCIVKPPEIIQSW